LACFELIIGNNLAQPKVAVHRDYHSRNLMVLSSPDSMPRLGIIDFQDALEGPITYDLVSLLRDAYIEWREPEVIDWAIGYWERARKAGLPVSDQFGEFYKDFEWMGLQRHIKVLGIFARLAIRDGKERYVADMPLVAKYCLAAAQRYIALKPLANLMSRVEGQQNTVGFTF
jgi:N-acetylmuramate 1-kinase